MRATRIPLSTADEQAIEVVHGASRAELEAAMKRIPTYQRTALRELARMLETIQRAAPAAQGRNANADG